MNEQDVANFLQKGWYDKLTMEYRNNGERVMRFFKEGKEVHFFHFKFEGECKN